jgi:hypothetical protein
VRCLNYDSARNFSRVIYLHEWNARAFYWGKAHNSFFGGPKRKIGDLHASGRYAPGYRHWIEGCLQHGGKLYIGQLERTDVELINEIEQQLIQEYGHVMNSKKKEVTSGIVINHAGDIPDCIAFQNKQGVSKSKAGKRNKISL